tara:strand:+ start:1406 stop:2026 length:621 start_codon:yes stop_codon:yes gene_type:complete
MFSKKYNTKVLLVYFSFLIILGLTILFYTDFEIDKIFDKSFLLNQSTILKLYINDNFLLFSLIYISLFIIIIAIIPFALPAIFLTSIIFNPVIGALISTFCITTASLIFFIFLIKSNLINLFNLEKIKKSKVYLKLKKNEFLSIFLFRITGGGGMPIVFQNIFLFYSKVSLKNFFLATLLGTFPGNLILSILGIGIFEFLKRFILS